MEYTLCFAKIQIRSGAFSFTLIILTSSIIDYYGGLIVNKELLKHQKQRRLKLKIILFAFVAFI